MNREIKIHGWWWKRFFPKYCNKLTKFLYKEEAKKKKKKHISAVQSVLDKHLVVKPYVVEYVLDYPLEGLFIKAKDKQVYFSLPWIPKKYVRGSDIPMTKVVADDFTQEHLEALEAKLDQLYNTFNN